MVSATVSYVGEAESVQVAGDFSDGGGASWQPEELVNIGGDFWAVTLNLLPGRYHYKIIVDGEWRLVEGRETVADESGHINSVLVVAEQEDRKTEDGGHSDDLLVGDKLGAEKECTWKQSGEGILEQTLEVSLNETPADSQLFDVLHSEANASFGICLDVSNELFEATVDLTVKENEGLGEKEDDKNQEDRVDLTLKENEGMLCRRWDERNAAATLADVKDNINVKRVVLARQSSLDVEELSRKDVQGSSQAVPDEEQSPKDEAYLKSSGEEQVATHGKLLSTTQRLLSKPLSPIPDLGIFLKKSHLPLLKTKADSVATSKVPQKTNTDLLERDLKRSASKEAPPEALEAGKADKSDNHSGTKPRSGNKENVCQQLLNMRLKANESKEKKNGEKKKLGTYKGLIVRNRTINAESDDDSPKEEAPSMNVVVEKAFLVTRVTKKDNVVKTNKVTRTLMSNTNRPWKRA